jgi:hypothetical protein
MTTIYRAVNTVNGRVYIGKTRVGYLKRWTRHLADARKGSKLALHRAIRRYGDDQFSVEPLCGVEDADGDFAEILFIAAAKSFPPALGFGYNLTQGGEKDGFAPIDTKKYGRLTILKFRPGLKCVVQCDCGSPPKVVAYDSLVRGKTKSCGCIRKEIRRRSKIPFFGLRSLVVAGYKRQGLEWSLTEDQFDVLVQSNCFYCGASPSFLQTAKWTNVVYAHNGLARKDNSKGFVLGNTVACCKVCLRFRTNIGHGEFTGYLVRAGNFQTSKNSLKAGLNG